MEILVLNGQGLRGMGELKALDKKKAQILVQSVEKSEKKYSIDLFLGCPKKEYFEEVCRTSVELGVEAIGVFKAQHGMWPYRPYPRLQKILQNSLLQSNNSFLPRVHSIPDIFSHLSHYPFPLFLMSVQRSPRPKDTPLLEGAVPSRLGIIVGPEGGFTSTEEDAFLNLKLCRSLHLPTPILRTVTAVPAGLGHLYALLDQLS